MAAVAVTLQRAEVSEDRDVGEWTTLPEHWTVKEGGRRPLAGQGRIGFSREFSLTEKDKIFYKRGLQEATGIFNLC